MQVILRVLSLAQSFLKGRNASIWHQREPMRMKLSETEGLSPLQKKNIGNPLIRCSTNCLFWVSSSVSLLHLKSIFPDDHDPEFFFEKISKTEIFSVWWKKIYKSYFWFLWQVRLMMISHHLRDITLLRKIENETILFNQVLKIWVWVLERLFSIFELKKVRKNRLPNYLITLGRNSSILALPQAVSTLSIRVCPRMVSKFTEIAARLRVLSNQKKFPWQKFCDIHQNNVHLLAVSANYIYACNVLRKTYHYSKWFDHPRQRF